MTADVGVRVTVLGSLNMDLVGMGERLPHAGQTVLGSRFTTVGGGKGANQATAAARAGGRCTMIGAVGDDAFGTTLRAGLAGAGVDVRLLRVAPGPSGVALIAVDDAGENQILVVPAANATLGSLTDAEVDAIVGAHALVCQLETPLSAIECGLRAARRAGVTTILNAAPARALSDDMLGHVDLLVVNHGEAEVVAGVADRSVDDLLRALVESVPRVAITLGANGVAYADRDGVRLDVPAPAITAVDTTAAGDAFVGALTVAWLEGRPIRDALGWACAAGAACAQAIGAADSLPARNAIDELFAQAYGGQV